MARQACAAILLLSPHVVGVPTHADTATVEPGGIVAGRPSAAEFWEQQSSRRSPKLEVDPSIVFPCKAQAVPLAEKRVRRAFHTLSREERDRIYRAQWIMHDTPTWVGQAIYGKGYKDYSDMVMQHSVAVLHPEGDAAHVKGPSAFQPHPPYYQGDAFGVWHRAFSLQWENVLRLIDPKIEALPYWDLVAESAGLPMFTADEFGSVPGTGPLGEVIDGKWANWTIAPYDADRYAFYFNVTHGAPLGILWNKGTGTSRQCPNLRTFNAVRLRNTVFDLHQLNVDLDQWSALNQAGNDIHDWGLITATFYEPVRNQSDLHREWNTEIVPLFIQPCWIAAGLPTKTQVNAVGETYQLAQLPEDCIPPTAIHLLWHNWVSGFSLEPVPEEALALITDPITWMTCANATFGDALELQASPNEPSFVYQHVNIDRSLMEWQSFHPDAGYTANYPTDKNTTDQIAYGHRLNDVLSYLTPFYTEDLFPDGLPDGEPAPTGAWTVADLLCHAGLDSAPYTYDTLVTGVYKPVEP